MSKAIHHRGLAAIRAIEAALKELEEIFEEIELNANGMEIMTTTVENAFNLLQSQSPETLKPKYNGHPVDDIVTHSTSELVEPSDWIYRIFWYSDDDAEYPIYTNAAGNDTCITVVLPKGMAT